MPLPSWSTDGVGSTLSLVVTASILSPLVTSEHRGTHMWPALCAVLYQGNLSHSETKDLDLLVPSVIMANKSRRLPTVSVPSKRW